MFCYVMLCYIILYYIILYYIILYYLIFQVYVEVDSESLPGSPFTYFVQPSSGVTVTDVTEQGDVGDEMYFIGQSPLLLRIDIWY